MGDKPSSLCQPFITELEKETCFQTTKGTFDIKIFYYLEKCLPIMCRECQYSGLVTKSFETQELVDALGFFDGLLG